MNDPSFQPRPNPPLTTQFQNNGFVTDDGQQRPSTSLMALSLLTMPYPTLGHRHIKVATRVTFQEWILQNWDMFEAAFDDRADPVALAQMMSQRITPWTAPLIPAMCRQRFSECYFKLGLPGSNLLGVPFQHEVMLLKGQGVPAHPIEMSLRSLESGIASLLWNCLELQEAPVLRQIAVRLRVEVNKLFEIHERDMMNDPARRL